LISLLRTYPFFFQDELEQENVEFCLDMYVKMDDDYLKSLTYGAKLGGLCRMKLFVKELV